MMIGRSLVVGCDGQIQWWVGRLVMGKSVMVGFVVRNWWWEDQLVNGFRRMGRRWVDWQRQWVGVWDVVGGNGCVLILVVFFFFFGYRNNFSGCVFFFYYYFFIYKVVLVDVGLCRWWLSALLQSR